MTSAALASQLRRRQYAIGQVERHQLDSLSNDEIIDCYVTCCDCGHKQVEGARLQRAIAQASDADEFFVICDQLAKPHEHK